MKNIKNGHESKLTRDRIGNMEKGIYILISVLLLPILGCGGQPIPVGKYIPLDGDEYIIVKASTIYFHIKIRSKPPEYFDKELDYEVIQKSTEINIRTMTSSEYAKFPDFYWDGRNIVKKSLGDNTTVLFQIRETQSPIIPKSRE